MRVSHSGTSNLKSLPNLPINWPVQRALKRINAVVRNWIFIVLTLHTRSYVSCKNQRLDLLSLAALTSQSLVEYRWNTGPARQFVLMPCYTYNFKCPVTIRLKLHVLIPTWFSYHGVQFHGLSICGSFTAGRQSWKVFQIWQIKTRAASPEKGNLCSPELDIYSTYSTYT